MAGKLAIRLDGAMSVPRTTAGILGSGSYSGNRGSKSTGLPSSALLVSAFTLMLLAAIASVLRAEMRPVEDPITGAFLIDKGSL